MTITMTTHAHHQVRARLSLAERVDKAERAERKAAAEHAWTSRTADSVRAKCGDSFLMLGLYGAPMPVLGNHFCTAGMVGVKRGDWLFDARIAWCTHVCLRFQSIFALHFWHSVGVE
jgi:hypothetical protein